MEPDTTRDTFTLAVKTAQKLEFMEQRLSRIERELAIQDRVLTELRRDLALHRPSVVSPDTGPKPGPFGWEPMCIDPTKPLPGTVAETS